VSTAASRVPEVMVIDAEGNKLGVMDTTGGAEAAPRNKA
jgi:translation initiation factor IF-3